MNRLRLYAPLLLALFALAMPAAQAQSETSPTGAEILALAREAAGGDQWANARTLSLSGRAIFYGETGHEPRAVADDYRMWRIFDPDREVAHGADGKVRIIAKAGDRLVFEVGFDGETTWTERGITPKAEADRFWASNFGFGIIRHAGKPGFVATRMPDDTLAGHALYMVQLTDPGGGQTLFGVDRESHAIRSMGFRTPKGWHQRLYDDFVELQNPRWLQARHVTLYYDGRKANEVFWTETRVNGVIDAGLFEPPVE
ncbi:hypothetical protein [Sphingorhabdus sp. YGSMI21]|uniref:hypothetical protein n=1 Tax=Sphingorhabdus sp. YGSMI21 TaxID=2077182 RepID=UPI000F4E7CA4|nr:hypothetical protein [Sphingorhabdus sp. YGSMI21]